MLYWNLCPSGRGWGKVCGWTLTSVVLKLNKFDTDVITRAWWTLTSVVLKQIIEAVDMITDDDEH